MYKMIRNKFKGFVPLRDLYLITNSMTKCNALTIIAIGRRSEQDGGRIYSFNKRRARYDSSSNS